MSIHSGGSTASYVATAALGTLYTAVKLDSTANKVVVATAGSDMTVGITQTTTAAANRPVTVKECNQGGFSFAIAAAGGWTLGDKLTPSTSGTLVATTTATDLVVGEAMQTISAGEIGEVKLRAPVEYSVLTGA